MDEFRDQIKSSLPYFNLDHYLQLLLILSTKYHIYDFKSYRMAEQIVASVNHHIGEIIDTTPFPNLIRKPKQ